MTRSLAIVFPHWMQHYGHLGEEHAFRSFEHVVRAITDVAPLVEVEDVGVIVLDARGPSRYFGGDVAVASHVHRICEALATEVPWGVGIASSRFAAMAAAHMAVARQQPCVIKESISQQFIDALPVASLVHLGNIHPDTVNLFSRLGLATCEALRTVGEVALIDRFGRDGQYVYRLVTGHDLRHLAPGAAPSDFARIVELETPLTLTHHVVSAAREVIDELVTAMTGHGQQCVRLFISCQTDHAESIGRIWGEPRGFSAPVIAQRLSYQLDGWLATHDAHPDAPTSGVVRIEFTPLETREVLVTQPLLWGGQQENIERAARAISMATAVSDSVVVTVPRWEGGRDVATMYAHVPVGLVDLLNDNASQERVRTGEGVARDWTGSVPRPSPALVNAHPSPIFVADASGDAVAVTGRHELSAIPATVIVGALTYEVMRIAGPWPVEERWWDTRRKRRQVRMQLLVRHPRGTTGVMLVGLEHSVWSLLARYN